MTSQQEDKPLDSAPEPSFWWALLSNRGQRGGVATAGILVRYAIPIVGVLFMHWSAQTFLLMAVITFTWNMVLTGVWNMATSTLTKARRTGEAVRARTWLQTLLVSAVVFCILTATFGFPVYYMTSSPPVLDSLWWFGFALTLLGPLPGLVELIRSAVAADLQDDEIEAWAKQRRLLVTLGIVPVVGAYGLLAEFPYPITMISVAIVYVLFSALCELRPDMAAEFAKELPPE
ncbi:MAG: hypothetical protein ABIW82_17840 [Dokdonella sp.]